MGVETAVTATGPSFDGVAVTKSDSSVLVGVRALWVGGAGDLTLTLRSGDVVIKAVPAGTLLPIGPSKVKSATTATDIVALY